MPLSNWPMTLPVSVGWSGEGASASSLSTQACWPPQHTHTAAPCGMQLSRQRLAGRQLPAVKSTNPPPHSQPAHLAGRSGTPGSCRPGSGGPRRSRRAACRTTSSG
jgi:hypothetical protein